MASLPPGGKAVSAAIGLPDHGMAGRPVQLSLSIAIWSLRTAERLRAGKRKQ
jgi:hypothetical protein